MKYFATAVLFLQLLIGHALAQDGYAGPIGTGSGGGGTVTSVSIVTANGISGTVANPTTTPAITLSCASGTCAPAASPTFTGTVTMPDLSTWTNAGIIGLVNLGVIGGTLGNGASAFSLTATQPASPVAAQNAVLITVTGAGSASQTNTALDVVYSAGYTGANQNSALSASNSNSGTAGNLSLTQNGNSNGGGQYNATGAGTGYNVGIQGRAANAAVNIGAIGLSNVAKNSGTNIGVMGMGRNTGTSPLEVGGWFQLGTTTIPVVSAALIADTADQSALPVALFQVGEVTVASINATGGITATLTQTSAAQSGTACYNSGSLLITYDATLGCLTSLEELKDIHGPITGALAEISALKPFWFTPINRPKGSDLAEQPGFGAHQVEAVDKRLVGYGADGALRGVRYMEMTALEAAAISELKHQFDDYRAAHP